MPKRVCILGSSRFADEIRRIEGVLTANGIPHNTFSGMRAMDPSDPAKKAFVKKIQADIDGSEVIYVINKGGYAGLSVAAEIGYARKGDKTVCSSEAFPDYELDSWVDRVFSDLFDLVRYCKNGDMQNNLIGGSYQGKKN